MKWNICACSFQRGEHLPEEHGIAFLEEDGLVRLIIDDKLVVVENFEQHALLPLSEANITLHNSDMN